MTCGVLILMAVIFAILRFQYLQRIKEIKVLRFENEMLLVHNKQLTACFDTFPEYKPPKVELPPKKQYEPGDWMERDEK